MTARDEILARIRRALADVPGSEAPEAVPVPRGYRERDPEGTLDRFRERVEDYGARVRVVAPEDVATAAGEVCRDHGIARVAVPTGLPEGWRPAGVEAVPDVGLDVHQLDEIGGALTGCALAIAETGTIVLDGGPGQGRRALTLVPDFHLCIVEEAQVVDGVPAAMRRLAGELRGERRPVTFVSGPSATSDIELARVEGVHGPRRLEVVLVQTGRRAASLAPGAPGDLRTS
jgi:L-lactate dehydrogenase complex protein LldG